MSTQVQRDVAQDKILKYLNPDWIVDIVMISGRKESPSIDSDRRGQHIPWSSGRWKGL